MGVRTSEGIRYGDAYQYYLGDKLEDYLRREGAFKDYEYPFVPHDIITRNGSWISEDDYPEQSDNSQSGTTTWASQIADFLEVSTDYLLTGEENKNDKYYLNDKTAQVAQEIFENKELRALFDVQKDMQPEDLRALHNMALALKRKERGDIDDTGC